MKKWQTLETSSFQRMLSLLTRAHENSFMYAIVAPPGCGKTFTYTYYKHTFKNVFYFKIEKTYSPKELYLLILTALGVDDYDRRVSLKSMADRVSYLLNKMDTKSLLIFDEAGKFSASQIEYFQQIRDATEDHVGIILSGTEKFRRSMDEWLRDDHLGIAELNSRIFKWETIELPTAVEFRQITKANGVSDPVEIKKIASISRDLRQLRQNIQEYHLRKEQSK